MAFGTITSALANGQEGSNVICKLVSMLGDGAYPAGGTADFQQLMRTFFDNTNQGALTVLAVLPQECAGYIPVYDQANDKLKVYESSADGNALDEVSGDQSAFTYNLLLICE